MNTSFNYSSRCFHTAAMCSVILILLLGLLLSQPQAQAATYSWVKFGSGNYNDPNNWFPGGTPGTNDFVGFSVGSGNPYTVTFPGDSLSATAGGGGSQAPPVYASRHLQVRDNGVTFSGSTQPLRTTSSYNVTSTSETETGRGIIIGVLAGDNAQLSLSHNGFTGGILSSLTTAAATLGDAAGSTGTLNVGVGAFNVNGSDFTQTQLIVGNRGNGTLNLNNGADVNVTGFNSRTSLGHYAGSNGVVNINGPGSTWTSANELWIGERGEGSLTVQNGGSLVTTGTGGTDTTIIGTFAGGRGDVTVTGPGSTWTASSELRVGNTGDGTLTITNGGKLNNVGTTFNSALATIGGSGGASGVATVTGAGSTWTTPGAIYVQGTGSGSSGALAVFNGGSLTSARAVIRGLNAGSGSVLVSGGGSTWNFTTGPITIGLPEPGFTTGPTSLTINPGAHVNVAHDIELNTNGTLNLQGGTLSVGSIRSNIPAEPEYRGFFNWDAGTLHADEVYGTVINEGGRMAPGRELAGRTEIFGNYSQEATATLEIELGGTLASVQHDYLAVSGFTFLGGDLDLSLINSFMPTAEQTFTILDSLGPLSGDFSNISNGQRLSTVDGLGSFLVNYGPSSAFDPFHVVLSDFASNIAPGDFNADGLVNGDDLTKWQDSYGENNRAGFAGGSANGRSFLDWQRNFVGGAAGLPSLTSVPEPNTVVLACVAALSLMVGRKLRTEMENGLES